MKNCFEPTTRPKRHKTYKKKENIRNIRGFACLAFPCPLWKIICVFSLSKKITRSVHTFAVKLDFRRHLGEHLASVCSYYYLRMRSQLSSHDL